MAVSMVANGRVLKIAAAIGGLLLTVYFLYAYRKGTSELQTCKGELSSALHQYASAQNVAKDLEDDARQARMASSSCQKTYSKLLEDSEKKKAEAEQSVKKLTGALEIERKTKEEVMAQRDQQSTKCLSENQSLRLQLDTSQKKCSEEKSQMQNRLDEVISHSDIIDKQQDMCDEEKEKLTKEKASLKAQNDELTTKLKNLQQQVKTLLEKASVQIDPKRGGAIPPYKLQQPETLEKDKRAPYVPTAPNMASVNVRKNLDLLHPDSKFAPIGLQKQKSSITEEIQKPAPNAPNAPNALPPKEGEDKLSGGNEERGNAKYTGLVGVNEGLGQEVDKVESESELGKNEDQGKQTDEEKMKQTEGLVPGPPEDAAVSNEKDLIDRMGGAEEEGKDGEEGDPDRPHQYRDNGDEGLLQGTLVKDEGKSKLPVESNDQS